MYQALFVVALIIGVVSMVKWYNSGVSKYGKEVVDKAIAKFHVGSFLLLCLLWIAFVMTLVSVKDYWSWYSVNTNLDIAKQLAGYIVGSAFISTAIIVVMLHRVRSAIVDSDKSIHTADTSVQNIGASLDKLNERIKTIARMVDDIKDIEQKISERPPVVIQKKEPSDK